jgi:hypothetical protein
MQLQADLVVATQRPFLVCTGIGNGVSHDQKPPAPPVVALVRASFTNAGDSPATNCELYYNLVVQDAKLPIPTFSEHDIAKNTIRRTATVGPKIGFQAGFQTILFDEVAMILTGHKTAYLWYLLRYQSALLPKETLQTEGCFQIDMFADPGPQLERFHQSVSWMPTGPQNRST